MGFENQFDTHGCAPANTGCAKSSEQERLSCCKVSTGNTNLVLARVVEFSIYSTGDCQKEDTAFVSDEKQFLKLDTLPDIVNIINFIDTIKLIC